MAAGAADFRWRRIALRDILVENGIDRLIRVAEGLFRRDKGIEPDASLEAAGFWFENDRFALNGNFLIGDEGLLFRYNEYEIAPYAHGATDLLVPYASIRELLDPEFARGVAR